MTPTQKETLLANNEITVPTFVVQQVKEHLKKQSVITTYCVKEALDDLNLRRYRDYATRIKHMLNGTKPEIFTEDEYKRVMENVRLIVPKGKGKNLDICLNIVS